MMTGDEANAQPSASLLAALFGSGSLEGVRIASAVPTSFGTIPDYPGHGSNVPLCLIDTEGTIRIS